jgi:hypothetical protein
MKIIDETGVELTEAPDLSLGRLIDDVEVVHHESIAGVKQVSHFVPIEHLANGSTIVEEVIDVPGVDPQPAWEETVPIQRYIRYTEDELAERRAKEEHEAKMAQMPETLDALKKENEMLKQCLLEMSETVYA